MEILILEVYEDGMKSPRKQADGKHDWKIVNDAC